MIAAVLDGALRWCVVQADCLEVMRCLSARSVAHVITDPPYEAEAHTLQRRLRGVSDGAGGRVLNVAPLNFDEVRPGDREAWGAEIARVASRWALVFCQVEAAMLWRYSLAPLVYKRTCVWVKPDGMPQLTGDRPGMGYESIVTAHVPGRSRWNGGGRVGVYTHNKADPLRPGQKNEHPTTKPLPLMLDLVRDFTDPGEVILDPFAGSGTTGVAALRLGRRTILIEKDPKYAALARERMMAEEAGSTLAAARAGQGVLFGS